KYVRKETQRVENVLMRNGGEVLAFHRRHFCEPGRSTVRAARIDEELGRFNTGQLGFAGYHGQKRVVNLLVQAVALDHDRRADLVSAAAGIGKPCDDHVSPADHEILPPYFFCNSAK